MRNINTAAGLGFARSLRKSISNRFEECKTDSTYLIVTVIDPRFKTLLMEPYEVKRVKLLRIIKVEKFISMNDTLQTPQTLILLETTTTVPVPVNSLWNIQ